MGPEQVISSLYRGVLGQELCRVCLGPHYGHSRRLDTLLREDTDIKQEHEAEAEVCTVMVLLNDLSRLKISAKDNFPVEICDSCFESIRSAYLLRCRVRESERILKATVDSLYKEAVDVLDSKGENSHICIVILEDDDEEEEQPPDINETEATHEKPTMSEINSEPVDEEPVTNDLLENIERKPNTNGSSKLSEILEELNLSELDCTICLKSFPTLDELKSHRSDHGPDSRHVCGICYRSYRKSSTLLRHYITHTDRRTHVCKVCNKAFFHGNALNAHMQYHGEKKFSCTYCDKSFFMKHVLVDHLNVCPNAIVAKKEVKLLNEDELKTHMSTHPSDGGRRCKVCEKTFEDDAALRRHAKVHADDKPYLCSVCGKSFRNMTILKSHSVYHGEKTLPCSFCRKKFHVVSQLREHVRVRHSNEKFNFMCEECGRLCTSRRRLIEHRSSHVVKSCPVCGKTYRNNGAYREHMKLHTGSARKRFVCDYCGEVKSVKTQLEIHILSKHLKERRFKCDVCEKGFFSNGSLKEHNKLVHIRDHATQCPLCPQKLNSKKAMIIHFRRHTGEKPYDCRICGESFISTTRRTMHEKCKHGEKTEFCSICPAKFFFKSELKKHMVSHKSCSKKSKKADKNDSSENYNVSIE